MPNINVDLTKRRRTTSNIQRAEGILRTEYKSANIQAGASV